MERDIADISRGRVPVDLSGLVRFMERAWQAGAAAEREACAQLLEQDANDTLGQNTWWAKAIRARGEGGGGGG